MTLRLLPFLVFCAMTFMQCKSNLAQSRRSYDSLLEARFGNNFEKIASPAGRYVLLQAKDTSGSLEEFNYLVVKAKVNDVVLEGKYNRGGYVKWVKENLVEQFSVPKHIEKVVDSALYKRQIFVEGDPK